MTEHREVLTGWGRTAATTAQVCRVRGTQDVIDAVVGAGPRGVIARGLGRSYGDPAQNAGGVVLDITGLDRIHAIDSDTDVVDVDAGVSLDTLMRRALPFGLWIPVLPGTRQVTVGGAIAADIHGKNHHVQGSFGNHVRSMDVVTADGEVQTLTPDSPLFWATVGGMGLTGVIVRARIRLVRVETAYFAVDTDRTSDLDGLLGLLADGSDDSYGYSVAWFDAVARGARLGRAVLTRGRSATLDELTRAQRRDPLSMQARQFFTAPDRFPSGLVNRASAGAFSELWWRKAPARRRAEVQNVTTFFHPLDLVGRWNRVYGPRGFLQYQFVMPFGQEAAFRRAVELISGSPHASFLNVLKRFGTANAAPLSFPEPGWTLTVDLPVAPGLGWLCDRLDELVLDAGGKLYLAKESRTRPEVLARMYPRLTQWRAVREAADPAGVFVSDLSRRLNL